LLSGKGGGTGTELISGTAQDDFRDGSSGGNEHPVMSIDGPGVSGETTGLIWFSLYSLPTEVRADLEK
jgi:hypothetical protein